MSNGEYGCIPFETKYISWYHHARGQHGVPLGGLQELHRDLAKYSRLNLNVGHEIVLPHTYDDVVQAPGEVLGGVGEAVGHGGQR